MQKYNPIFQHNLKNLDYFLNVIYMTDRSVGKR